MAVISAEQRAREVEDRTNMLNAVEEISQDEQKAIAAQVEIRDRLMRRLIKRKVVTILDNAEGQTFTTRLMNGREREKFIKLNKMLDESRSDLTKYNTAMEGLKE